MIKERNADNFHFSQWCCTLVQFKRLVQSRVFFGHILCSPLFTVVNSSSYLVVGAFMLTDDKVNVIKCKFVYHSKRNVRFFHVSGKLYVLRVYNIEVRIRECLQIIDVFLYDVNPGTSSLTVDSNSYTCQNTQLPSKLYRD